MAVPGPAWRQEPRVRRSGRLGLQQKLHQLQVWLDLFPPDPREVLAHVGTPQVGQVGRHIGQVQLETGRGQSKLFQLSTRLLDDFVGGPMWPKALEQQFVVGVWEQVHAEPVEGLG